QRFKDLVNVTPDTFLTKSAKNTFTNSQTIGTKTGTLALTATTVNYKFPWQEFNNKTYSQSWHGALTPGLDFRSTATDRRILSAAAGTVTNVSICTYSVNVTVSHADGKVFKYLHLNKSEFDSTKIKSGVNLPQGKKIGLLRKGSFSDNCGYAKQTSSTHHLHWGLPTTSKNTIDQWSILSPNTCWTKPGYSNRCVNSTFGSTNKEV
ncbi:peptidoglycan DD-metalloendopeptidase family protein, partial [Candidatus Dojkabacteria bacterium]|nr:peptidoglycan DD-metalloendopeptidase family protein [Candidatus Dojkabacteria bacterium]